MLWPAAVSLSGAPATVQGAERMEGGGAGGRQLGWAALPAVHPLAGPKLQPKRPISLTHPLLPAYAPPDAVQRPVPPPAGLQPSRSVPRPPLLPARLQTLGVVMCRVLLASEGDYAFWKPVDHGTARLELHL